MAPKKVCILGSGNWGSTIARLVGVNAANNPEKFERQVNYLEMYEQRLGWLLN